MKRKTRYPLSQVIPQNSSSTGYTQITWGTSISIECNKGVWERMPLYTPGRYTCIILTVLLYRSNESTSNPYQRPHFHSTKKNKFCLWKYIYIYISFSYTDICGFIHLHACLGNGNEIWWFVFPVIFSQSLQLFGGRRGPLMEIQHVGIHNPVSRWNVIQ